MDMSYLTTKNNICKVMTGSRAYGTSTPSSDTDMRGIFCADPINILTPFYPTSEITDNSEEDTKYYELSSYMSLLVKQNPNILEILWVRDEDVLSSSDVYRYLRDHRSDFISSKIAHTTSGYAMAQLKRIKSHRKWINNPQQVEKPQQRNYISLVQWFEHTKILPSKFNINDFAIDYRLKHFGNHLYGIYKWQGFEMFRPDGSIKDNFDHSVDTLDNPMGVVKFNKQQFSVSKDTHTNYWTWKKNRNPTRAKLEEDFGVDLKHAMHLIRLLRTGYEAITTGNINVFRPDAAELLAIRNGSMTYDEIIEYAESLDNDIKVAYSTTDLPREVNLKKAAAHLMHTQQLIWNNDDE